MRLRLTLTLTIFLSVCTCVSAGQKEPAIGRITATYGQAVIGDPDGVGSRAADIHSLIVSGQRIATNGGGVSLLLASRVVVKIDASTAVRISERLGETSIHVEYGTVHVFCGKRPASKGAVAIHDDNARIETPTRSVILVSYDPKDRRSYYACEEAAISLEPANEESSYTLPASNQAIVVAGKIENIGPIDGLTFASRKKAFERLGQSAVQSGADTFRLRSRTADLNMAMSSLAAAGWIDPRTLPRAQRLEPAKPKQKNDAGNDRPADSNSSQERAAAAPPSAENDAAGRERSEGSAPVAEVDGAEVNSPPAAVDAPPGAMENEVVEAPAPAISDVVDQPIADIAPSMEIAREAPPIDLGNAVAPPVDLGDTVVAPEPPELEIALPDLDVPEVVAAPESPIDIVDVEPPASIDLDLSPAAELPVMEAPEIETPVVDVPVIEVPDIEAPIAVTPEIEAPAEIEIDVPAVDFPEIAVPEIQAPEIDTPVVEAPPVEMPEEIAPPVEIEQPEIEEPIELAPPVVDIEPPEEVTGNLPEPVDLGDIGAVDEPQPPVAEAPPSIETPEQIIEVPTPDVEVVVPEQVKDIVKDVVEDGGRKSRKD